MTLTNTHKIIIGIVGLGIVAYATKKYWMPKKKVASPPVTTTPKNEVPLPVTTTPKNEVPLPVTTTTTPVNKVQSATM